MDAGDGGEGEVGRAELAGGWVEAEMLVEVGRAFVTESFVGVDEEFEGDDVEAVSSDDVGEWHHVDVEKGWAERGSLGDAVDGLGGFRQERRDADSLSSIREEGCDPVQGLVVDPDVVEACAEGVVTDGVEGCRQVKEDEGSGFTFVEHDPDVVGCNDESGLGAVVLTEAGLRNV
ncbi:hypothetical protein NDU88_003271 [Pleurodeles waltl]|uniref:Uncharacterized protein n=1 Tax=Pleurodeles waltl TaxID=8319 RepID=A0AAV7V075_PLEWA|nr:hypothetical protein NDU88_003271 [Pleurodeles waltl]